MCPIHGGKDQTHITIQPGHALLMTYKRKDHRISSCINHLEKVPGGPSRQIHCVLRSTRISLFVPPTRAHTAPLVTTPMAAPRRAARMHPRVRGHHHTIAHSAAAHATDVQKVCVCRQTLSSRLASRHGGGEGMRHSALARPPPQWSSCTEPPSHAPLSAVGSPPHAHGDCTWRLHMSASTSTRTSTWCVHITCTWPTWAAPCGRDGKGRPDEVTAHALRQPPRTAHKLVRISSSSPRGIHLRAEPQARERGSGSAIRPLPRGAQARHVYVGARSSAGASVRDDRHGNPMGLSPWATPLPTAPPAPTLTCVCPT